jgi:tRNA(fMet)-specific endonuclease VapC
MAQRILSAFSGQLTTSVLLFRNVPNLRALLEAKGEPIGANDYLVAAIVAAEQGVLVTGNIREFRKVPGLKLENWLAA